MLFHFLIFEKINQRNCIKFCVKIKLNLQGHLKSLLWRLASLLWAEPKFSYSVIVHLMSSNFYGCFRHTTCGSEDCSKIAKFLVAWTLLRRLLTTIQIYSKTETKLNTPMTGERFATIRRKKHNGNIQRVLQVFRGLRKTLA